MFQTPNIAFLLFTTAFLVNPYCSALEDFFANLAYYGILQPEDAQCFQSNVGLEPTFYILFVAAVVLSLTTSFVVKAVKHYFRDLDPYQTALVGINRDKDVELAVENLNDTQASAGNGCDIQPVPVLFTDQYRWLLRRESAVKSLCSEETPATTSIETRESLDVDIGSTAATLFENESKPSGEAVTRSQVGNVDEIDDEDDVCFVNSGQILNLSSDKPPMNQASGNVVAVKSLGTGFGAAALGAAVLRRGYDVDDEDFIFQSMSEVIPSNSTGDDMEATASSSIDVACPPPNELLLADDDAEIVHCIDSIGSVEDKSIFVVGGSTDEIPAISSVRSDDAKIDSLQLDSRDEATWVGAMNLIPHVPNRSDEPSLSSPHSVESLEVDSNNDASLIGSSTLIPLATTVNTNLRDYPVLSTPTSATSEFGPRENSTLHVGDNFDEPAVSSPSAASVISVHSPGTSAAESPGSISTENQAATPLYPGQPEKVQDVSPMNEKTETSADHVDLSRNAAHATSLNAPSSSVDQTANRDDDDDEKQGVDSLKGDDADDFSMATTDNHSVGSDHTPRRTLQMN
jgi:hypothetical protein